MKKIILVSALFLSCCTSKPIDSKREFILTLSEVINNPDKFIKNNDVEPETIKKLTELATSIVAEAGDKQKCIFFLHQILDSAPYFIQNGTKLSDEQIGYGLENIKTHCGKEVQPEIQ